MTAIQQIPASSANDRENPGVVARNKEPEHVSLVPFLDESSAHSLDRSACPFVKLLNGTTIWAADRTKQTKPTESVIDTGLSPEQHWTRVSPLLTMSGVLRFFQHSWFHPASTSGCSFSLSARRKAKPITTAVTVKSTR